MSCIALLQNGQTEKSSLLRSTYFISAEGKQRISFWCVSSVPPFFNAGNPWILWGPQFCWEILVASRYPVCKSTKENKTVRIDQSTVSPRNCVLQWWNLQESVAKKPCSFETGRRHLEPTLPESLGRRHDRKHDNFSGDEKPMVIDDKFWMGLLWYAPEFYWYSFFLSFVAEWTSSLNGNCMIW